MNIEYRQRGIELCDLLATSWNHCARNVCDAYIEHHLAASCAGLKKCQKDRGLGFTFWICKAGVFGDADDFVILCCCAITRLRIEHARTASCKAGFSEW